MTTFSQTPISRRGNGHLQRIINPDHVIDVLQYRRIETWMDLGEAVGMALFPICEQLEGEFIRDCLVDHVLAIPPILPFTEETQHVRVQSIIESPNFELDLSSLRFSCSTSTATFQTGIVIVGVVKLT